MAMTSTAIRFAPQEKSWIQGYADFIGQSFSEVVRSAVLDKIEDEADVHAYDVAIAQDDGTRYSFDEVKKELGF